MSKIAIQYAIDFSKDIEFDLVLLHVMDTNTPPMARVSSKKLEEAIETSSERDMNIICIGTKGATGLKKVLLGSNAAGIIENSCIPVLTIPEYGRYRGVKNRVYSRDLLHLDFA